MKTLKYKFDLDCKVSIYVPSTTNVNEKCDNSAQVMNVITELSKLFGGATASQAVGGWVCEDGNTVVENVTIVYAFCTTDQLNQNIDKVISICETLKKEMSQEAISLEINGQLGFI